MDTLTEIKRNIETQFGVVQCINVFTGTSPIIDMDLYQFIESKFNMMQGAENTGILLYNGRIIYSCAGYPNQQDDGEPNRIIFYMPKSEARVLKQLSKVFSSAGFYVTAIKSYRAQ